MWIAYRPAGNQAIVFKAGHGDSEDMAEQDFKDAAVATLGGVEADYHYYQVTDTGDLQDIVDNRGTAVTESGGVPVSYVHYSGVTMYASPAWLGMSAAIATNADGVSVLDTTINSQSLLRPDGITFVAVVGENIPLALSSPAGALNDTWKVYVNGAFEADFTSAEGSGSAGGCDFFVIVDYPGIYSFLLTSELQGAISFTIGIGWPTPGAATTPLKESWIGQNAAYLASVSVTEGTDGGTSYPNLTITRSATTNSIDRVVSADASGNIALTGTVTSATNFQSGTGVVFVPNRTAAPTGNPTAGGYFYVESGALKYRGSSGTVTTIAPA